MPLSRVLAWLPPVVAVVALLSVPTAADHVSLQSCITAKHASYMDNDLAASSETVFTLSPLDFGTDPLLYVSKLWTETVLEVTNGVAVGEAAWRWDRLPWASVCHNNVCRLSAYDSATVKVSITGRSGGTVKCTTAFAPWTAGALAVGLAVFLLAPYVAHAVAFHYALGAVLAVVIVLRFMVGRPKSAGVPFLAVLFAANRSSYLLQQSFGGWVTWGFSAALVFAVLAGVVTVYIFKPNENPNLCNVIQWSLQFLALATIVLGSTSEATPIAGAALALTVMCHSIVYTLLRMVLRVVWYVLKRLKVALCGYPRRKLLSVEEYEAQKARFTAESLLELKAALSEDWLSVVKKLKSKATARKVHDWAFYGEEPVQDGTTNGHANGGSSGFVVDDQGRRVDAAADDMTDVEFEQWRVQSELQWELEMVGEEPHRW